MNTTDNNPTDVLSRELPVAVIGLGTMGHGIAQAFAVGGYTVRAIDERPETAATALDRIANNLEQLVSVGLLPAEQAPEVLGRITVCEGLEETVDGTGFVTEAAWENLAVKQAVFGQIEPLIDQQTILASNSSSFPITETARDLVHPERAVVTHWFNPPHVIPVVEVVGGEQTPVEIVDWTCAFYAAIGKKVIRLKKEIAGFVSNRLQSAIFREYASLIDQGIVSVEDADVAVAYRPGLRWAFMGPTMTSHVASPRGIEDAMSKYEVPPEILQERDGQDKWSPELSASVVKAAATMSRNRPVDELWRQRDETLVSILEVLKKHDW